MATWAAALLTGGTLLLGMVILLRERAKDASAQAQEFQVWGEGDLKDILKYNPPYRYNVTVRNISDYPVMSPLIDLRPKRFSWRERGRYFHLKEFKAQIPASIGDRALATPRSWDVRESDRPFSKVFAPKAKATHGFGPMLLPYYFYDIHVYFSDASNRRWRRNLETGRLVRYHGWRTIRVQAPTRWKVARARRIMSRLERESHSDCSS